MEILNKKKARPEDKATQVHAGGVNSHVKAVYTGKKRDCKRKIVMIFRSLLLSY